MVEAAYFGSSYASALSEFGRPRELKRSGGWYLERSIRGSSLVDGIGTYPYLVCRDWRELAADLDDRPGDLVTFSAVPDPFGDFRIDDLERAFPDRLHHFKDHFVADLSRPLDDIVSSAHRRRAEKALHAVEVSFHERPSDLLDEWMELFGEAIVRFGIRGIPAFSRASFEQQFRVPGVVMSIARDRGVAVAAHVQFRNGDVVYAHVAAGSEEGRRLGADFALYYSEILRYRGEARWLDWGGHAGARSVAEDGLSRFKSGWSSGKRPVYFAGRIVDPRRYEALCETTGTAKGAYFPAYRQGEFS